MSQLFASGGQSTGVSASTSVLPVNTQDWSPLGWTGWISLQSKGLSRVFSNTTVQKHQSFGAQLSFILRKLMVFLTFIHDYRKNHSLVDKVMSLLFNILSNLVITFLPRSKHLLISWLQSPSAVISFLGLIKIVPVYVCFSEAKVQTLSCVWLCDPMDCSLPGSSVHGIFQARILECVPISFSRGSSQPRDWTQVWLISGRHYTIWTTRDVLCMF